MAIAIDFGTSNTVVARWNPDTQQAETLSLPELSTLAGTNPPLIPSLIYVSNAATGEVVAGQLVRDRGLDIANNPRFFRNFKRGIGAAVPGFLPDLDGCIPQFEQLGEWFLHRIIQTLTAIDLEAETLDSLVLTVPVDSFETYRHWLGQVVSDLPIPNVQLLDEPTAAALGYGLGDRNTVLVIDIGGGTLDLSLVRLEAAPVQATSRPLGFLLKWGQRNLAEESAQIPKTARVLAKTGQNLGGADIDQWLADYFAETQDLPITPLTLKLVERLKIELSSQPQATVSYFDDETLESYTLSLDRDRFQDILTQQGGLARLDDSMTQVLQQAQRQGLTPEDIEAVLLVGGTAQIPAIRDWVEQYFTRDRIYSQAPFEAIAHGALQLAQGLDVEDFLYHSYGVRYWNRRTNAHDWHPIISKGQPYPMTQPVELVLGASVDNQPSIELIIGELGDTAPRTEVFFEGDRLITKTVGAATVAVQPLNDTPEARQIAQLNPPGFPGRDRIRVQFQVDAQRQLRITVEDLLSNTILVQNQPVVQLS